MGAVLTLPLFFGKIVGDGAGAATEPLEKIDQLQNRHVMSVCIGGVCACACILLFAILLMYLFTNTLVVINTLAS